MVPGLWYLAMVLWLTTLFMAGSGQWVPFVVFFLAAVAASLTALGVGRRRRGRSLAELDHALAAGLIDSDTYRKRRKQLDDAFLGQPF